jgi:hypothetical protein
VEKHKPAVLFLCQVHTAELLPSKAAYIHVLNKYPNSKTGSATVSCWGFEGAHSQQPFCR